MNNHEVIRLQLTYPEQHVEEPILYHLVVDYGLMPNIRRANMESGVGGYLLLELSGEPKFLRKGIAFLEGCSIEVTSVGLDGDSSWAV